MSNLYSFSNYDKYLSLKISPALWLVIIYFLRPYVLMVSGLRIGRGGGKLEGTWRIKNMVYPDDFSLFIGIAASIPALLVIFAYAKRKPGAAGFVRRIWRNGVKFLLLSAALNVLILFIPLFLGVSQKFTTSGWVQLVVSALIIWYLFTSQRIKDTFADFPPEENEKKVMKTNGEV